MIICSANQIGKMYGGNAIFENITFEIKAKERVGLVGRNGSGKTTLIRLLAREETPDAGQIYWKKDAVIGYLSQIPDYQDTTTTKDVLKTAFADLLIVEAKMKKLEREMAVEKDANLLQKLMAEYGALQDEFALNGGYEIEASIEKIVLGLNMQHLVDQSFSKLSGGEKTKAGLGLILLKQPDLLLLDEPTNHLDLMAVEWLGSFLKEYPGTVLVISHDRYFLDEAVNKVLDMEDGEVTIYHTNFTRFVKEKEERLLKAFQDYEEQQKKIKKMKEAIKRLRDWANRANPPNADLHRRARNMERALERIEKIKRPILNRKKMNLEIEAAERSGKDVITLEDVSKSIGDKKLFQQVNMHIAFQDRVAIIGENGTGKSTLLKLILQEFTVDKGQIRIGSNVKIGYLSQHVFSGLKNETVLEAFRNEVSVTEGEARGILARFMFYGYAVFQKVSSLSGGERMRLRLAQLMHQDVNLLILDEPTNHLDIDSREVLEEALEEFEGTILAVSHDRYFINKLFSKIYWIEEKAVHAFAGNYTWAKEKMAERREHTVQLSAKNKKKAARQNVSKTSVQKPETLENEIFHIEDQMIHLENQLSETRDIELLQTLYKEKEALETKWEMLCVELEQIEKETDIK